MPALRTLVFTSLLLSTSIATAAPAEPSGMVVAKKHYQEGKRFFVQMHYRRALKQFLLAHRNWGNRVFLYNIALCYAKLGQPVAAVKHLRVYLRGATTAERNIPEVLKQVQTQVGILRIHTSEPMAALFINGQLVGHGQVESVVKPGAHPVEIRRGGQVVLRKTLTVAAGQEERWTVRNLPKPQKRTPPPPKKRKIHTAYFYATVGLAAATFGAALGLYFKTDQIHEDYNTQQLPSLRTKGMAYQNATNALLGVSAGALVAAGIMAIFTRWRKRPERAVAVTVAPTAQGRGAVLGVSWSR